ncbi:putative transporter svop-1 isoform X1 [Galleria mellonella]|uniref:Transporter svop-1 isoform X1 n=1 Tax=Galleria mellonella TaxID=7137 RepID=A0A6J3BNL8_GALME|nr:putative transporter svop-1 isoform X1 [Galleria mellonella]
MTAKLNKVPFEDALTMTGFSKFNYFVFALCSSIIMGMCFEIFSVAYLVPASVCELNTTSSQQGLMAGTPLIGIIATSHIWGYLADTRGRKKVLCFSMFLGFVTGAMAALSPNWIVFSVLKLCASSAVSGSFALSIALLSECTPVAKRSTLIMLTTTVFMSCTGIMAVLAIPVLPLPFSYYIPVFGIQFNSWRLLSLIYTIPCALSSFGLLFAYESPKYLLSIGDQVNALKTLREIFVINNGKDGDSYPVNSVILDEDNLGGNIKGFWASIKAQTVPLMKPPLLYNTLLLAAIFLTVYFSLNPFIVWMPYLVDGFMRSIEIGADGMNFCEMIKSAQNTTTTTQVTDNCALNETAMTMVFVTGMLLAVLNTLMSVLINYLGRKNLLIGLQLFAGVSALCLNLSYNWILSAILFVVFIAGNLNFGLLSTFSVDLFPTYVKAMAVCLTLMVGRGGAVLGINLLKNLLDSNCGAAFYIFGSVACLGGIFGFLLPSDKKMSDQNKLV